MGVVLMTIVTSTQSMFTYVTLVCIIYGNGFCSMLTQCLSVCLVSSAHIEEQWQREFEEKAKKAYEDQMNTKVCLIRNKFSYCNLWVWFRYQLQMLSDETIHDLESQFQDLIEHEAHQMKDARIIRAQKLKQMEEEEIKRKERMEQEMKGKNSTCMCVCVCTIN